MGGGLPAAVYRTARHIDGLPLLALDTVVLTLAYAVGLVAGFEGDVPAAVNSHLALVVAAPVLVHLAAHRLAGLYGSVWRYASVAEAVRILAATAAGAVLGAAAIAVTSASIDQTLPMITMPAVAALVALVGCGGVRFQARLFALERGEELAALERVRTLIVGAGDAGASVAGELQGQRRGEHALLGFVATDPSVLRRRVRGLPVLGAVEDLEALCRAHRVERLLVALPELPVDEQRAIVERALRTDAQVKVVPRSADLLGGTLVRNLRDIDVADLLQREHNPIDVEQVAGYLADATVLVTGAGGSIGSELARQVARYNPAALLLLERDETLLHDQLALHPDAVALLVDIRDREALEGVFRRHRPEVVFHAAALKHVPMLEAFPLEAIETNVVGTRNLVELAAEHGVRRFVGISTDKAAEPCSAMGATKRAAEIVISQVASKQRLPAATVRFGNVLGSRGSVVPTFLRQIMEGGPVTVTDEAMRRYFMTIPEAVSLVLQAGSQVHNQAGFALRMGEPVRIMDLAHQMIRMAGLRPGVDIPIEITGLRPGERLEEQLSDDAEVLAGSEHPSIDVIRPRRPLDAHDVLERFDVLADMCERRSVAAALGLLQQILRSYGVPCNIHVPAPVVIDLVEATLIPTRLPVVLGGEPAFPVGVTPAVAAYPALPEVVDRFRPSYERGSLSNGRLVEELEARVAEQLQVDHVVAVSSGISGLLLALAEVAADGGEVLLPSFTSAHIANAVTWNGLQPRFGDCDPASFHLDPADAAWRADGVRAIVASHTFGAPCRVGDLEAVATRHGIPVLFDGELALGASSGSRPLGSRGNAEIFSLGPTSPLLGCEGGLVATTDADLAHRLRLARDSGESRDASVGPSGLNSRLSEVHAAIALGVLDALDEHAARRRELAAVYRARLSELPGVRLQAIPDGDSPTHQTFVVAVDASVFGLTRDQVLLCLAAEGIPTGSPHVPPLHRQRSFAHLPLVQLPFADDVAESVVSLPMHAGLTEADVERVADVLWSLHAHARSLADNPELAEVQDHHPSAHPRPAWRRLEQRR